MQLCWLLSAGQILCWFFVFVLFFQAVSSSGTRGIYIIESFKVNDVFFSLISSPLVIDEIKIKRGRRKKQQQQQMKSWCGHWNGDARQNFLFTIFKKWETALFFLTRFIWPFSFEQCVVVLLQCFYLTAFESKVEDYWWCRGKRKAARTNSVVAGPRQSRWSTWVPHLAWGKAVQRIYAGSHTQTQREKQKGQLREGD